MLANDIFLSLQFQPIAYEAHLARLVMSECT